MQVYLPDPIYRDVKENDLPASELLQAAVIAEMRRRALEASADNYLRELLADVGEPTERELESADQIVRQFDANNAKILA
jgi:hypothetical protein